LLIKKSNLAGEGHLHKVSFAGNSLYPREFNSKPNLGERNEKTIIYRRYRVDLFRIRLEILYLFEAHKCVCLVLQYDVGHRDFVGLRRGPGKPYRSEHLTVYGWPL